MAAVNAKLTQSRRPDGEIIHMPPPAVDRTDGLSELSFPPKYGEHTSRVLREAGLTDEEYLGLRERGIVFG